MMDMADKNSNKNQLSIKLPPKNKRALRAAAKEAGFVLGEGEEAKGNIRQLLLAISNGEVKISKK